MKKLHALFSLVLGVSGVWFFGWGCGSGWAEHPKNWVYESEFLGDSDIRATPELTVILGMEKGTSKVRHSIPYLFEERAKYNFCIDEDDPLLDSMKLVNAEGATLALVNRKHRCVEKTIPRGRYTMHVYHDGQAVGDSLRYAFIHRKKVPLPLGENNPWAVPSPKAAQRGAKPSRNSKAGAARDPLPSSGYWTVEASNGKALRSLVMQGSIFNPPQGGDQPLVATGNNDIPILRFSFDQTNDQSAEGALTFGCQSLGYDANTCVFNPTANNLQVHIYNVPEDYICDMDAYRWNCYWYTLIDVGNYKFLIDGLGGNYGECVILMDDGTLSTGGCDFNSGSPNIFTLAAINDVPAAQVPADSLQKGQAALYDQPDCSGTATVVMPGNHELEASAASVRMPHDTRITLYQQGTGSTVVLNGGPTCINMAPEFGGEFVAESMAVEYTPDILISTTKCRYCDLYGLSLQNKTLDGFDFSYAYLANTHFNKSSMKGVNLSHSVLAGAQLDQANLQGSNLCNAFLQGNVEITTAASLNGAYMKNVNLSGATLSGVSMINTDFYNTGALPCPASCDSTQMTSTCATAAYATMDDTQATPAYLARADFSGMKTTGANFSGSILVGASFSNAQLHTDTTSTARTNFGHAFLQGADFSGASVDYASFSGAYVDLNPQTALGFQIPGFYTQFNGFWSTSGSSICVNTLNPAPTVLPTTTSNNICPDGNSGPCSTQVWTSLSTLLDQADPKAGYGLCPCDVFANCGDKTWSK